MDPIKTDRRIKGGFIAAALAAVGNYYINHRKEINKAVIDFFKRLVTRR